MAAVAIDIDSTLYDFTLLAQEEAVRRGGDTMRVAYTQWQDWRTPPDLVGMDEWIDIIDTCHADDRILAQEPFPGAVDTVRDIYDAGHRIIYVSTRRPEREDATVRWLLAHGFPEHENIVATLDDKQQHIKHCQFLIDDRPKTVVEFVYDHEWKWEEASYASEHLNKPRHAFVKAHPYNINLTDIPGIYVSPTWAGLRVGLEKKGVLPTPVLQS